MFVVLLCVVFGSTLERRSPLECGQGDITTEAKHTFKVSVGVYVWAGAYVRVHYSHHECPCHLLCSSIWTSVMDSTCPSGDCFFHCSCSPSGVALPSQEICFCCHKSLIRPSGRAHQSRVLPARDGTFLASVCETCWVVDQVGSLLRDLPRSSPAFCTASDGLQTLYELLRAAHLREVRTQTGRHNVSSSAAWASSASSSSAREGSRGESPRGRSRSPRR